jgi:hypothetical protein
MPPYESPPRTKVASRDSRTIQPAEAVSAARQLPSARGTPGSWIGKLNGWGLYGHQFAADRDEQA